MGLLEINTNEYAGTAVTVFITVIITSVLGWIGNLFLSTFKKINDSAETKAKVDALKIEHDKLVLKVDEEVKYLQQQINDI